MLISGRQLWNIRRLVREFCLVKQQYPHEMERDGIWVEPSTRQGWGNFVGIHSHRLVLLSMPIVGQQEELLTGYLPNATLRGVRKTHCWEQLYDLQYAGRSEPFVPGQAQWHYSVRVCETEPPRFLGRVPLLEVVRRSVQDRTVLYPAQPIPLDNDREVLDWKTIVSRLGRTGGSVTVDRTRLYHLLKRLSARDPLFWSLQFDEGYLKVREWWGKRRHRAEKGYREETIECLGNIPAGTMVHINRAMLWDCVRLNVGGGFLLRMDLCLAPDCDHPLALALTMNPLPALTYAQYIMLAKVD